MYAILVVLKIQTNLKSLEEEFHFYLFYFNQESVNIK